MTFDPRNEAPIPKFVPFILFPRQRDFVNFILGCLRDKEHGLVEKSRDMGATWLCCAISVWLWIFHRGSTVGWGSLLAHSIDDRGNPKAIFLKIRQLIQYIPSFFRPAGFNQREHAPLMKIIHPNDAWMSTIIGEGGINVGRGGRTSIYFKDESAHYQQAEDIEAALGDNTNVSIDISSVNGTNNVFYRKRMSGEVWYPDQVPTKGALRIFIFDWSENPFKTREWYNQRRAKAEREGLLHIFMQEVERNYNASVDRLIIRPEWVEAAIDAHKVLSIRAEGERIAGQDVADEGGDKNAWAGRHGVILRHAESFGGEAGDAARVAIPLCIEWGSNELYYDSIGVGAGFKTEINTMMLQDLIPRTLLVMPWSAAASVMDPDENIILGDPQSPTNFDQYENLKAQSWFRLRSRFYKTFRAVRHGDKYDHGELISIDSTIPRLHEIKNELSQAQYKTSKNGKTMVDKKPKGASSPNLADAIVQCFSPVRELSIFDVL